MKWYEEVLLMLAAISTNVMVDVNSYSEIPFMTVLVDVAIRFVWTAMVYLLLDWIYRAVKEFIRK